MLTLRNFEPLIDQAILQRGKQYYRHNAIAWIEETEDNRWQAEVEGSATYQVNVTLKNQDEIGEYFCDCPYEGSICKHIVAVFFALREEVKKTKKQQSKTNTKKDVFENLLQTISPSEYQDFIRRYAAKDKDFKTEFELYFAGKDERIDVEKKYGDLIRKIIRKYSDRGYIDYQATFGLSGEVDKLLESGQDLANKNNFKDAFTLARVVLKAMMEAATECDDSNGTIGETIASAIQLIDNLASAAETAIELKEQVFIFLQKELDNKIYFDYGDYGYDMFALFQKLAVQLNKADEFLKFIDAQIPKLTGKYDDYRKEFFLKQKIEFLAAIGKTQEAEQLILQNLDIVEVRQGEVNKATAKGDFVFAKKLIADGIKIAESKIHPGTVSAWQKELLRIAVLEKDLVTIRHYTKHFAFDRGFDLVYYQAWKATFTEAEWKEEIEKYIRETIAHVTTEWNLSKGKFWRPANPPLLHRLAPVYIQEQYWDRLLALVQKENNLETALQYHDYLAPRYPAELLKIYLPAFEQYGQQANGRTEYADLVNKMKRVMKDIPEGKEQIKAIARSLKEMFPRRPAMQEELNKLLK